MRILFVDDSMERHVTFSTRNSGESIAHAYTYEEAIVELQADYFSLVSLDHDLASEHYVRACSANSGCGCDIVDWICERAELFTNTHFVIHSWNPDAAVRMHNALISRNLTSVIREF